MLAFENEYSTLMKDLFSLNKALYHPGMRKDFGRILTRNVPKFDTPASPKVEKAADDLNSAGFHMLPQLPEADLKAVLGQLLPTPIFNSEGFGSADLQQRREFKIEDRPETVFLGSHRFADVIRCRPLVKLATNPVVVGAIAKHLDCTPTISAFQVWHSFPGKGEVTAELFHRDRDCFSFAKLFLYLSDVDETAGPHQFIRYSQSVDSIQKFMLPTRPGLDINKLFPQDRSTAMSESLVKEFASDVITFTGPAGTAFIESTYGLHRGTRPTKSRRTIFSVTYSGLPIRFGNDNDRAYEMNRSVSFKDAGLDNPSDLERYMFRFFLA